AKDEALRRRFLKRGFSVTLKDRSDPNKPFDVRPFKGWLEQGRIVRKGQKGVAGLFHVTQTDPLPAKTAPKAKDKKACDSRNPKGLLGGCQGAFLRSRLAVSQTEGLRKSPMFSMAAQASQAPISSGNLPRCFPTSRTAGFSPHTTERSL